MRPIDADRLLQERRMHTYYQLPNGDIAIPLIDIKNAPTVDLNRRVGEWIDKGWKGDWQFETDGRGNCWHEYECSECGFHNKGSKSNYCPDCGMRMKGVQGE